MSAEDDMAWPAGTTVIPADPPSPLTERLEFVLQEAFRGGYVPELPIDLIVERLIDSGVTLDAARAPAPAGLDVEALAERVRVLENTIIEFFIYYDMDDYAALGIPEKALADVIGNDQVPSGSKP